MRIIPIILSVLLALATGNGLAIAQTVTVYAASSLGDVIEEIATSFQKEAGFRVVISTASSSTLARQVEAGAPADVIALASTAWADYLAERGAIVPETRIEPVGNRLVLVAAEGTEIAASTPPTTSEILAALGPHGRLAIGDPAHVPAGTYARQALTVLGLWQALESRLAIANDARAALALVARGDAPLGIVYATDARIAPRLRTALRFAGGSHQPITYTFAQVTGGNQDAALKFLDYLSSGEVRKTFLKHGFERR